MNDDLKAGHEFASAIAKALTDAGISGSQKEGCIKAVCVLYAKDADSAPIGFALNALNGPVWEVEVDVMHAIPASRDPS